MIKIFLLSVLAAWLLEWLFYTLFLKKNMVKEQSQQANKTARLSQQVNTLETENAQYQQQLSDAHQSQATIAQKCTDLETALQLSNKEHALSTAKLAASIEYTQKLERNLQQQSSKLAQLSCELEALQSTQDKKSEVANDLSQLSGIGPKVHAALNACGINRFQQLIDMDIDAVLSCLKEQGVRVINKNSIATWAQQAKFAHQGNWQALEQFKKSL